MRRWLKYGVVRAGGVPVLLYERDVNRGGAGEPYWITQLHHEPLMFALNTYFSNSATGGAFYLPVRFVGSTDPPAPDCLAPHIHEGFVCPYGATLLPPTIGSGIIAGFYLSDGSVGPRILDDSSSYGPLDPDYDGA